MSAMLRAQAWPSQTTARSQIEILVRIGGRHHIGIVGGRPGRGRMTGKTWFLFKTLE